MHRWTRALGGALLLVGISAGSALAWPDRLDGRPDQFEVGGDSAYYICSTFRQLRRLQQRQGVGQECPKKRRWAIGGAAGPTSPSASGR